MNRALFDSVRARLEPDERILSELRQRVREPGGVSIPASYGSARHKAAAFAAALIPVMLIAGVLAVTSQRNIPAERSPVAEQSSSEEEDSSASAVLNKGKKYAVSDIHVFGEDSDWFITDPQRRLDINNCIKRILASSEGGDDADETAIVSFSYTYDQQDYEVQILGGKSYRAVINGKSYRIDAGAWYDLQSWTTKVSALSVTIEDKNGDVQAITYETSDAETVTKIADMIEQITKSETTEPDPELYRDLPGRTYHLYYHERGVTRLATVYEERDFVFVDGWAYIPDSGLLDSLIDILEIESETRQTDTIYRSEEIGDISVRYSGSDFTITNEITKKTVYNLLLEAADCKEEQVSYTGGCKRISFKVGDIQWNVQFSEDEEHLRINGVSYSAVLCYTELWDITEELSDITVEDMTPEDSTELLIDNDVIKARLAELIEAAGQSAPLDEGSLYYRRSRSVYYYYKGVSMKVNIPLDESGRVEINDAVFTADPELYDELIALTDPVPHMNYSLNYDPDAINNGYFKEYGELVLSINVSDELIEAINAVTDGGEGVYIFGFEPQEPELPSDPELHHHYGLDTISLTLSKVDHRIVFTNDEEYPLMIDGLLFRAEEAQLEAIRQAARDGLMHTTPV